MGEVTKHTRRWFQFSLGTLFIVVTVTAVAAARLAWELAVVRERQVYIDGLQRDGATVYFATQSASRNRLFRGHPAPKLPHWRYWLGDEAVHVVDLNYPNTTALGTPIETVLPEAIVYHMLK